MAVPSGEATCGKFQGKQLRGEFWRRVRIEPRRVVDVVSVNGINCVRQYVRNGALRSTRCTLLRAEWHRLRQICRNAESRVNWHAA